MTKFFTVEQVVVRIAQGQKNKQEISYFLKHGKEKMAAKL